MRNRVDGARLQSRQDEQMFILKRSNGLFVTGHLHTENSTKGQQVKLNMWCCPGNVTMDTQSCGGSDG